MRRSMADLGDLVHLKAIGPGQVKVIVSFIAFIYLYQSSQLWTKPNHGDFHLY